MVLPSIVSRVAGKEMKAKTARGVPFGRKLQLRIYNKRVIVIIATLHKWQCNS